MSNKVFIAIVVMILVVFALIYVNTPLSDNKPVNETTITTQEKSTNQVIYLDDITESTTLKSQADAVSEKGKHTIKVPAVSRTKDTTTKKKIVISIRSDEPKTTKSNKTIKISIDEPENKSTTATDEIRIRVRWSNQNGKEKGSYTIMVAPNTIITEDIISGNLIKRGYTITTIQTGQEYIGNPAVEKEYMFELRVSGPQKTD